LLYLGVELKNLEINMCTFGIIFREKAEEIARIRSELKERGLFVRHWCVLACDLIIVIRY